MIVLILFCEICGFNWRHNSVPLYETVPVHVGLSIGAFNAKLLSASVLVYVVDWFAYNAKLLSTSVLLICF